MRVYHSPLLKRYIDLDSITSISDAEFFDQMGHRGFFVGFEINLKLHDKPMRYERPVQYRREGSDLVVQMTDGSWGIYYDTQDPNRIFAVSRLQAEIEVLVAKWVGLRQSEESSG